MRRHVETLGNVERAAIVDAAERLLPQVLPADWRCIESYANGGWYCSRGGLRVMATVDDVDAELWLHLSISRAGADPSYADLRAVKALFVGKDRKAMMVLPRDDEHYNLHPHCLHLFVCVNRSPLPDFRDEEGRL